MNYNFTINDFEGPLHLLLHLIKINKMDIENINLESITLQYLEFINKMKNESIDIASEYLVMASELIHLKSKLLINSKDEEIDEYEFNSEDELKERLIQYNKIKDVTSNFKDLELNRGEIFTKLPSNLSEYRKNIPISGNLSLDDLINAFESFLNRENLKKPINTKITKKELSTEDRIIKIRGMLNSKKKISFYELFDNYDKPYVIVTFLSILEMSKNDEIKLVQDNEFGDITLEKK